MVGKFVAACREFGIKPGLYISPWDRNHPSWGTDKYNDIYAKETVDLTNSVYADYLVIDQTTYNNFLSSKEDVAFNVGEGTEAKQVKVVIKEIRFGPQTDDHDYNFKLKHAENFLKEGAKVKAYVFFRGRSIVFKEQGEILLLRFANDLEEFARVELMPKLDGKKMNMILAPKSKK